MKPKIRSHGSQIKTKKHAKSKLAKLSLGGSTRPKDRRSRRQPTKELPKDVEVEADSEKDDNWKTVPVDIELEMEMEGFGGIEELTDYGMLPTDMKGKRSKESDKGGIKKKMRTQGDEAEDTTEFRLVNSPRILGKLKAKKRKKKNTVLKESTPEIEKPVDTSTAIAADMSKWDELFVPDPVLNALADLGFTAPTPIQALTLPSAIRSRMDILGAAETGSGKTLAFGIPLLHGILQDQANEKDKRGNDNDVALTENNKESEKDHQISSTDKFQFEDLDPIEDCDGSNLDKLDNNSETNFEENSDEFSDLNEQEDDANSESKEGELITLREERILYSEVKMPERPLRALILTPTRELALQVQKHIQAAAKYTTIRVALIVGGMAPQKQVRILKQRPEIVVATPGRLWELIEQGEDHLNHIQHVRYLVIDEADRMAEKGHFAELEKILDLIKSGRGKRQNFVFSATLTLVHDIPKRLVLKKKKFKLDQNKKLESIMSMVGMKSKPKIVDLSKKFGTVDTLIEAKIFCEVEEKDFYLYYFWLQYPGRTLVFCNSIDCVRRLTGVFELLNCHPLPLHASMQQRQRLKNLDRFTNKSHSLLLATDVAARGLDIPGVEHVIHYQIPRTAEGYVHRSGRTARALTEGLSLMFLSSQEVDTYRKMCRTLNRDKDLPDFPVDQSVFHVVQQRMHLARELETLLHRQKKKSGMNRWITQAAESLGVEVDDKEILKEFHIDSEEQAQMNRKVKVMKQQLNSMLQKLVIPRGVLSNYPTKSGKLNLPSETSKAVSVVGNKVPWQQVTVTRNFKPKAKNKWKKKKNKGN